MNELFNIMILAVDFFARAFIHALLCVLSLALAGFLVLNSLLSLSPLLLLYLPGVFSFIVYLVFYL